jgi:hypothetical protein
VNALPDRLPVILTALHAVLFLTTAVFGERIASGGNPLLCVDIPASLPLVASDSAPTVIVVGILATAWWYFVGAIARESWRGKISRAISLAGAMLLLLVGAVAAFAMISEFRFISQEPNFGARDFIVYALALILLLGNAACAAFAAISGLSPRRKAS